MLKVNTDSLVLIKMNTLFVVQNVELLGVKGGAVNGSTGMMDIHKDCIGPTGVSRRCPVNHGLPTQDLPERTEDMNKRAREKILEPL